MNWLIRTFSTSVGKKQLMAVTGLLFLLFLTTHLLGNLSIYGGPAAFVDYATHLHALGKLLVAAEVGMAVALLVHVTTAVLLFFENRRARPVRYAVDKSGGGRTFSSQTMPYTGLLILGFIGVHLATFSHHIVDQTTRNIFQIAVDGLLPEDLPGHLCARRGRGRLSCPAWSVERLPDGGSQPSQVHALYPKAEHCLRRDRRHRLWLAAVRHPGHEIGRSFHAT